MMAKNEENGINDWYELQTDSVWLENKPAILTTWNTASREFLLILQISV